MKTGLTARRGGRASVGASRVGRRRATAGWPTGRGSRIAPSLIWRSAVQARYRVWCRVPPNRWLVESNRLRPSVRRRGWAAIRSPRTVGSGSGRVVRTSTTPMRGAGRVADREPDQIGVEQLDSRARSMSFGSPCQVAQAWLQHHLRPLQLVDVVPYDLPPTIGMPESRTRGHAPDPVADRSRAGGAARRCRSRSDSTTAAPSSTWIQTSSTRPTSWPSRSTMRWSIRSRPTSTSPRLR